MAREKYNVTLAGRADKMLIAHTEFLARVSLAAARRLLTDFRKATKLLAENPFQFPYADELDALGIPPETYRKCLFDGRYKALYIIEFNEVYIDAVIDCRQENSSLY
jgi:plasmid stabilization system protein ParE